MYDIFVHNDIHKIMSHMCRWEGHVARMGIGETYSGFWWGNLREKFKLHRMPHEKPARHLVDQRGRRSRTLYRKLNKCKCKVLTG